MPQGPFRLGEKCKDEKLAVGSESNVGRAQHKRFHCRMAAVAPTLPWAVSSTVLLSSPPAKVVSELIDSAELFHYFEVARASGLVARVSASTSAFADYSVRHVFKDVEKRDKYFSSAHYQDWVASLTRKGVAADWKREEDESIIELVPEPPPHAGPPPRWKICFVVFVSVYTVSSVFNAVEFTPAFFMRMGLPFSAALFVNIFISIVVVFFCVVPIVSLLLKPWLRSKPYIIKGNTRAIRFLNWWCIA
jgi:antibiotic biosynthesis monooxygenase (ABM) superfamily enzyme